MSGGVIKLNKDEILFRENDESDAMYVIRKGRIAITKTKGASEIILAELGPGHMLGEMAFFDNRPRSAGAKAIENTEVIKLPFAALYAQFKTFPEWLKSMVKTVNSHLRDANMKIKNLQTVQREDQEVFPPDVILRLTAIISLIGFKSGEETEEGLVIPSTQLRNYTIQIFHQPTNKMTKLTEVLSELGLMKTEDMGEGRIKTTIIDHKLITSFVDWYNKWLFAKEADRVLVEEKEVLVLEALLHYGKQVEKDDKGFVTINLTEMQNNSMRDLDRVVAANDIDSLASKGLVGEKNSGEGGVLTSLIEMPLIEEIVPYWKIIYALKKVTNK